MEKTNNIGLHTEKSQELAQLLNELLANYSVFYQNTRGYHWNIAGDKFFELHSNFEELYNGLQVKIDEVAERIKILGFKPEHRFSEYLEWSQISESAPLSDGAACVENILVSLKALLQKQRRILQLSAEVEDEGTNSLMSDYIRAEEKMVWMYSAFLDEHHEPA